MVKERKIIGEGAYGCVHKPSLHCLNKNTNTKSKINYKNYVSKIMKTDEAEKELKEFVVIGSYDNTNEFHLGMPILCQPELNETIINNEISGCKHINFKEVKKIISESKKKKKILNIKLNLRKAKKLPYADYIIYAAEYVAYNKILNNHKNNKAVQTLDNCFKILSNNVFLKSKIL